MCGIAGYFGPKQISEQVISQTLKLMRRRGPDQQRFEEIKIKDKKFCYMLHARLSIIDIDSRSSQPFHYKDKILIYNGEIYNYVEVREKLKILGHQFNTTSDTEVFIHALDEWGIDSLNIVEGMWTFALYDLTHHVLTLSRDPFGEKPLYIYQPEPEEIYFGSEIKFISALSQRKFTVNRDHLCRLFVNGYKALFKKNETFFLEVIPFPKASVIQYHLNGQRHQCKFWHPIIETNSSMSFHEAANRARELILSSVKDRLRADIPIAFCMSGGVDSNSLISIAKQVFGYDVHGFTLLNSDSRYDEREMVNHSVAKLGIKHSGCIIPKDNFLTNMKEMVRYHDAPLTTTTSYLNWILQSEIRNQGYHISISGTAADELFSGYFDHHLIYMYDIQNDPELLKESIANWQRDIAPVVRNPFLQNPYCYIEDPFSRHNIYLHSEKYSALLKRPWQEPFAEKYYRKGFLQNRMMNEIFEEITPIILHEDDLNAMYFSIENRAPFLDRRLFEFCHSIPAKYLIQNGMAKAILRKAMDGIVPDRLLSNKTKIGFNASVTDFFDLKIAANRQWLLADSPLWDFFDQSKIIKLLELSSISNSDSKFLFSILNSKIFLEEFS